MKFRKRPVIIEATQWFKNGDCPLDTHPGAPGSKACSHCGKAMHNHGWIDTLEGGHIVCPGDWIITGVAGERYPCKPAIFDATYEAVDQ